MQKHRSRDLDELLAVQNRIEEAVAASSDTDEKTEELRKRRDTALAQVNSLAGKVSEGRIKAVAPPVSYTHLTLPTIYSV